MPSGGGNIFSSNQRSNSETKPWKGVRPYLKRGFAEAQQNVLDRPLEFFPESTAVPFSPETETALAAQTGRAAFGNPLNQMSQEQVAQTLGGEFLGGGQGYEQFLDSLISDVRPGVDAMFAGSGRAGSPLHAESLGRGIGRGMAPIYSAERDRMMQASGLAPELANQDYFDIQQLAQVGKGREDLFSRQLQDQIDRFNFGEEEPYNRIARFMGLLEGGLGFSENKAKTIFNPNPLLTMNALASDAASTGSSVAGSFMGGAAGCAIAREVYGIDNPKWLLFRRWLFKEAPVWVFRWYMANQYRVAEWLGGKPTIKRLVRCFMDRIIEKGSNYA
ncbi:MAG: hypothetical protein ACR2P5_05355 [Gammaproteobacteria bacterium]